MNRRFTPRYDKYEVEERELNPTLPEGDYVPEGFSVFNVWMNREGNTVWSDGKDYTQELADVRFVEREGEECGEDGGWYRCRDGFRSIRVIARDQVGAVKIANERRVRAIAEGRWEE